MEFRNQQISIPVDFDNCRGSRVGTPKIIQGPVFQLWCHQHQNHLTCAAWCVHKLLAMPLQGPRKWCSLMSAVGPAQPGFVKPLACAVMPIKELARCWKGGLWTGLSLQVEHWTLLESTRKTPACYFGWPDWCCSLRGCLIRRGHSGKH